MSEKMKCMEILPYISGLYQTRIITSGEKNFLVSCLATSDFYTLLKKIEELFQQTGNRKAKAIIDIVRKE